MPTFNGSEGNAISLDQAAKWTADYRNTNDGSNGSTVKAHFYGREVLQQLLDQEGCVGIRVYYGIDEERQKQLILVGADTAGNDMEDLIIDGSHICPPDCSTTGGLNG
jgi:hypothetical protein